MQFPPEVEQWRPLVQKYFPANLVDKALWTIQYESSGNSVARGDGGIAVGLFQIQSNEGSAPWHKNRPDPGSLSDPDFNIRYAAEQLGAASGNFSAWGENNLYNGEVFGGLGNHPFPGSTEGSGGFNPAAARNSQQQTPHPAGTTVTERGGGSAEARANELIRLTEQAWGTLDSYLATQDGLIPNMQSGIVVRMVPDELSETGYREEIDNQATKLLQQALSYEDQLGRLLEYRDQGLISFGEDNASAFLNSEKEASSEAERAYQDYRTRVGDVFDIEAAEGNRADQIGQAADAATAAHITAKEAAKQGIAVTDSHFRFPGQEEGQGFRDSIKATIPGQAPAFRPVNQGAISQAYPTGSSGSPDIFGGPLSQVVLGSRGSMDTAQSTLDRIRKEGINLTPKFDPIRPPVPEMTTERIDLGPAGFTPENYIQRYLLPGIRMLGNPIGGFR